MVSFNWHNFTQLSPNELYAVLALRSDVFIVEQNCIYNDLDGKDYFALHLLGIKDNSLAAYLRLFPPTTNQNYLLFGRVVTARNTRSKGYGKRLIQELINYCENTYPNIPIKCSAQMYLKKFYESFGFINHGESYQEDGIEHILMERQT